MQWGAGGVRKGVEISTCVYRTHFYAHTNTSYNARDEPALVGEEDLGAVEEEELHRAVFV